MFVNTANPNAPLYEQLVAVIKEKIQSNEWPAGHKLPAERELCEMYSVSRITVRRALDEAVNSGLVERVHGVGNFVTSGKMRQALPGFKSFAMFLEEEGLEASTRIEETKTIMSDFGIARILNIPVASSVQVLKLVGLGGKEPLVFYESFLAGDRGREVVKIANELAESGEPFSTLDIHRRLNAGTELRVEQTLEATLADELTASTLKLPIGSAIFRVDSVIRSPDGVLEHRIAHYRGDKYKFAIERNIP